MTLPTKHVLWVVAAIILAVGAVLASADPAAPVSIELVKAKSEGDVLTYITNLKRPPLSLNVKGVPSGADGTLRLRAREGGELASKRTPIAGADAVVRGASLDLVTDLAPGKNYLILEWIPDGNGNAPSATKAVIITVDQTPPEVQLPVRASDDVKEVILTFNESGFNEDTINNTNLEIRHKTVASNGTATLSPAITWNEEKTVFSGKEIRLNFSNELEQGSYELTIKAGLQDDAGNSAVVPANPIEFPVIRFGVAPIITPVEGGGTKPVPGNARTWLTRNTKITLNVENPPLGNVAVFVNGVSQPGGSGRQIVADLGTVNEVKRVYVVFTDTQDRKSRSAPISVLLDTVAPKLEHAELVELPTATGTGTAVLATFAEDDFGSLNNQQFGVFRQTATGEFETSAIDRIRQPEVDGRTVRLHFDSPLVAGEYQLVVSPNLKDAVGNAAKEQTWVFSVLAGRRFAKHVEFPQFSPPKKQVIPRDGFNPNDFVATRVARLYYYRNAHDVAQILNRNVRSYNQAAVSQAERRAESARTDAEDKTDARRAAERDAVRAAQETRRAEAQLAEAMEMAGVVDGLDDQVNESKIAINRIDTEVARLDAEIKNAPSGTDPQTIAEKNKRKDELTRERESLVRRQQQLGDRKTQLGGENIDQQVDELRQHVAGLRNTELDKQEKSLVAEAAEQRAAAERFRQEVTAATEDPGTYVPGDINSVDPVTQVSISVIGEGLIHLRGPIKGINKIRTMINQIDSPVGQVKIGVFTVQVNGEKGDKMEEVIGDIEGQVDLSRFLVNQSLGLLRKSIQMEAAMIASQCDAGGSGHMQVDRDRRYLYGFFGRDFIDELYAMNSEFLYSENKLLSLHAMDTVSLNRALFILALAKNDVRQRVIDRFLESAKTELPDAEFDFRRSSELRPHRTQKKFPPWNLTHLPVRNRLKAEERVYEAVHRNAMQRYHFRNIRGFFDTGFDNPDTMNPMQREFIKLAQIFKARLVAEMEFKQRFLERGLIEDRSNDDHKRRELLEKVHYKALLLERDAYAAMVKVAAMNASANETIDATISEVRREKEAAEAVFTAEFERVLKQLIPRLLAFDELSDAEIKKRGGPVLKEFKSLIDAVYPILVASRDADWATANDREQLRGVIKGCSEFYQIYGDGWKDEDELLQAAGLVTSPLSDVYNNLADSMALAVGGDKSWEEADRRFENYHQLAENADAPLNDIAAAYRELEKYLRNELDGAPAANKVLEQLRASYDATYRARMADKRVEDARMIAKKTRGDLDHRKLLDHLIDEEEDQFIELVEGTRSHIAVMDNYLKRLSIALEDDFKVQFYDPAFVGVRDAARATEVNLGQVERTTILTNNRAFAKVDPQATMEFDLPKRQIAIKEAFSAAKALVQDTGALINDPTFLAAFQMMGGGPQASTVKNVVPSQSASLDQQHMGHAPPPQSGGEPGSALQNLVPEPSVFKLETGTGFQLRPVVQPDGDSVIYDFDYMYTTTIREPVRADEKHLGRIKRHFVHTAVQTSSFELREISRYMVALKVSRTSRGVPLLEEIPFLGAAFKPAPSDESSIQQNIILGQTTVYPTLFDLMGLRWAPQVVDLNHTSLIDREHVIRGRQKSIRDYVFAEASKRVDDFLDVKAKTPTNFRPDFYHPQSISSPHHPGGYTNRNVRHDPSGNNFERIDPRPMEMQDPPYDLYRHRPARPERIGPQFAPEEVAPRLNQNSDLNLLPPQGQLPSNNNGTSRRRIDSTELQPVVRASYLQPVPSPPSKRLRRLPPPR